MKAGPERKHTPETFGKKKQADPVNCKQGLKIQIREHTDETLDNQERDGAKGKERTLS